MTSWRTDVRAALPGWVAGRALVAVAWGVVLLAIEIRLDGVRPVTTAQGLFAWDGAYYRDIAVGGYDAVDPGAIRFHPLVPVLAQSGLGVLLLANLGALAAGALVHRLTLAQLGDADLARRAATLVGILPPAFCLVWAYVEGPFLALGAAQLLALRSRRWWATGVLGGLATLVRPTGLLLSLPAAVEGWRERSWRSLAAIAGPPLAMVGWLAWVDDRYGDGLRPLEIQSDLRGGVVFPPFRLVEGLGEMVADPFGDGLHVPFAFGMVALVWVAWRKLPLSWAVLVAGAVVVNLAADNLNSIERYAFGVVPVIVAVAAVAGGRWWRPTVAVSCLLFVGMTALAWYGRYVP